MQRTGALGEGEGRAVWVIGSRQAAGGVAMRHTMRVRRAAILMRGRTAGAFQRTGRVTGASLSLSIKTRILAGAEALAFLETT